MHLTGEPDRPPVRPGVTVTDYLTGVFAAQAVTALLYERDARGTGTGGVVDAYLYGSALRILEWTIAAYDKLGTVRNRSGNRLEHSAPLDNYASRDGRYVCIVAAGQTNFERLCQAMGQPELVADERYATAAARGRNNAEINGVVADWAASLDAAEIEERCVACDVPVGTVYDAADLATDDHVAARGDICTVDDPVNRPGAPAGSVPPLRSRAAGTPRRCSPPGRAHRRSAGQPAGPVQRGTGRAQSRQRDLTMAGADNNEAVLYELDRPAQRYKHILRRRQLGALPPSERIAPMGHPLQHRPVVALLQLVLRIRFGQRAGSMEDACVCRQRVAVDRQAAANAAPTGDLGHARSIGAGLAGVRPRSG